MEVDEVVSQLGCLQTNDQVGKFMHILKTCLSMVRPAGRAGVAVDAPGANPQLQHGQVLPGDEPVERPGRRLLIF